MAFGYRDIPGEIDFLLALGREHAGRDIGTLLDLGSGTGGHCIEAARKGVEVTGLDLSDAMIKYASKKAELVQVPVAFTPGDMTDFDLGRTFDAVTVWLGTFMHLTDVEKAADCMTCVSRHLAPGGVCVIEVAHPGDMFDGTLTTPEILGSEQWEQSGGGEGIGIDAVAVQWGSPTDDFNPESQVIKRKVTIAARGDNSFSSDSVVHQRHYTVGEFRLLARLAKLEMAGLYGEADPDLETGLFGESAYRMFVVMRKPKL